MNFPLRTAFISLLILEILLFEILAKKILHFGATYSEIFPLLQGYFWLFQTSIENVKKNFFLLTSKRKLQMSGQPAPLCVLTWCGWLRLPLQCFLSCC